MCPQIKSNAESLAAVFAVAARHFMVQTRQTRRGVIGACDLGLIKIAVPIFVGDAFLGSAEGCGLLTETEEVEYFMIQYLVGLDASRVEALIEDIAPMTAVRAIELADELTARIPLIVGQHQDL